MAKWQRNDALGFLLIGVNGPESFIGYHIVTCETWQDWLRINSRRYDAGISALYDEGAVTSWFRFYTETPEMRGKHKRQERVERILSTVTERE